MTAVAFNPNRQTQFYSLTSAPATQSKKPTFGAKAIEAPVVAKLTPTQAAPKIEMPAASKPSLFSRVMNYIFAAAGTLGATVAGSAAYVGIAVLAGASLLGGLAAVAIGVGVIIGGIALTQRLITGQWS